MIRYELKDCYKNEDIVLLSERAICEHDTVTVKIGKHFIERKARFLKRYNDLVVSFNSKDYPLYMFNPERM